MTNLEGDKQKEIARGKLRERDNRNNYGNYHPPHQQDDFPKV